MSRYASGHASAQLRRVAGALAQVEPPSGSNRIRARHRQRGAVKREPEPAQFFRMDEVNAPVSVNLMFHIELMSRAGSLHPQSSRPSTWRAACSHQAKTGRATSGDCMTHMSAAAKLLQAHYIPLQTLPSYSEERIAG